MSSKVQANKSVIFLTNDKPDIGDIGNQRTYFFIKMFTRFFEKSHFFELMRIDFNQEFKNLIDSKKNLPFAADIEFSIELLLLLETKNSHLMNLIETSSRCTVLIVDNCYLAIIAIEAKKLNPELKIIYISHNLESNIKKTIGEIQKWPLRALHNYVLHTFEIENLIINLANITICCSEDDKKEIIRRGSNACIVIPNGAFIRRNSKYRLPEIQELLGCQKFVLFVASGHPPNVDGFLNGIGLDFGFLKDKSRIVIVGSSGRYISELVKDTKYQETFLNKASVLGFINDDLLSALYGFASAIVLPIFKGGGTNIKTAEAFLNSNLILATEFSLRGFDNRLTSQSSFKILDNEAEFKLEINEALALENVKQKNENSQAFTWDWINESYENELLIMMENGGVLK